MPRKSSRKSSASKRRPPKKKPSPGSHSRKRNGHTSAPALAATILWLGNDLYECASRTTPDLFYKLEIMPSGRISCQCPNYKKHRGRFCWHGLQIKAIHDKFTDEQRRLWPTPYDVSDRLPAPKSPVLASKQFYLKNARRREPPFIRYADNASLLTHKSRARTRTESRGLLMLEDLLVAVERDYSELSAEIVAGGGHGRTPFQRAFAVVYKVVNRASLTTTIQRVDRKICRNMIGAELGKNSLHSYHHDPLVRDVLRQCLMTMAITVSPITRVIDFDQSGFPTLAQMNYRNDNKGRDPVRPYAVYIKGHVVSCAATNIVGAVIPTYSYGEDTSDYSQFVPLLAMAKLLWQFKVVTADKAYFSDDHLIACADAGATFICPPKVNWDHTKCKRQDLAQRLFDLYYHHRDEFDAWYSWRAKVESVFSTIEQLYGKAIWNRGEYGRDHSDTTVPLSIEIEILAKFVAQNLTQFVYLEEILEQEVDFVDRRLLHPLPKDRLKSGRSLLVAS